MQDNEDKIIEIFRSRIKKQNIVIGIVITLIAISGYIAYHSEYEKAFYVPIIIGVPSFIYIIIFSYLNYRCPKCERRLSSQDSIPKFCPECGIRLKK